MGKLLIAALVAFVLIIVFCVVIPLVKLKNGATVEDVLEYDDTQLIKNAKLILRAIKTIAFFAVALIAIWIATNAYIWSNPECLVTTSSQQVESVSVVGIIDGRVCWKDTDEKGHKGKDYTHEVVVHDEWDADHPDELYIEDIANEVPILGYVNEAKRYSIHIASERNLVNTTTENRSGVLR